MNISALKQRLLASSLFKDSFWALFGNVLGKGLSVLAGILVARFLGRDIYGEYGILNTTIIQIGMFSTFGLGYTATKYVAEFKNITPEKLRSLIRLLIRITLISSTILSACVFLFADQLAILLKEPNLSKPIRLCSIIVIFNALTLTQIGILSGLNLYKVIAKNNTLTGFLVFILCCTLTYNLGFNGAIYSLLISQIFNFIINRLSISKSIRDLQDIDFPQKGLVLEIINFSLPVALQESCVFIFAWLYSYMLLLLSDYGQVGLNAAAAQWSAIILFIPGVLRNVTLSHLSGSSSAKDHKKIMKAMMGVNTISTLIPYLCVLALSPIILKAYGQTYVGLGMVMAILNASTIPNSISNVYVQEFMSLNKNWPVFILRFLKDGVGLVVFIFIMKANFLSGALALSVISLLFAILYFISLMVAYSLITRKDDTK